MKLNPQIYLEVKLQNKKQKLRAKQLRANKRKKRTRKDAAVRANPSRPSYFARKAASIRNRRKPSFRSETPLAAIFATEAIAQEQEAKPKSIRLFS